MTGVINFKYAFGTKKYSHYPTNGCACHCISSILFNFKCIFDSKIIMVGPRGKPRTGTRTKLLVGILRNGSQIKI